MDAEYAHISNSRIPAGYTYFAQFVLHDVTFGAAGLSLRSVYGERHPRAGNLYDEHDRGRFRLGASLGPLGTSFDVPRNTSGQPQIPDARNDHTLIVAQIHAHFLQLHNHTYGRIGGNDGVAAFAEAKRQVRMYYQALVLDDLLTRVAGREAVEEALAHKSPISSRLACLRVLPLEFTLAVARFGHAMVQPRYRINDRLHRIVFRSDVSGPFADLRGQPLSSRAAIEWENFFPIGHPSKCQASSKLNTKICRPLFEFPFPGVTCPLQRSIPYRSLLASQRAALPSGQVISRAMKCEPVPDEVLWRETKYSGAPAPLWFYILREAEHQQHGERLGEVGSRILAGAIVGLMESDRASYLRSGGRRAETDLYSFGSVGNLMSTFAEKDRRDAAWARPRSACDH